MKQQTTESSPIPDPSSVVNTMSLLHTGTRKSTGRPRCWRDDRRMRRSACLESIIMAMSLMSRHVVAGFATTTKYEYANYKRNPIPLFRQRGWGTNLNSATADIDRQDDESLYGRGEMHLSAILEDGDAVVYQTGTWEIDAVVVGDGTPAKLKYAKVIDVQIVWTHNCEHGVIRALDMELISEENRFVISSPLENVEFGPDQLLAKIPMTWDHEEHYSYEEGEGGNLLVELPLDFHTKDESV